MFTAGGITMDGNHNIIQRLWRLTSHASPRAGEATIHVWPPSFWLLGGIECGTPKSFLVEVPDRSHATLEPIITEWIQPGTRTVRWMDFNFKQIHGGINDHSVVVHEHHFVDPEDESVHTQNIENKLGWIKRKLKHQYGTSWFQFSSYLLEHQWRTQHRRETAFTAFLCSIAEIYPVWHLFLLHPFLLYEVLYLLFLFYHVVLASVFTKEVIPLSKPSQSSFFSLYLYYIYMYDIYVYNIYVYNRQLCTQHLCIQHLRIQHLRIWHLRVWHLCIRRLLYSVICGGHSCCRCCRRCASSLSDWRGECSCSLLGQKSHDPRTAVIGLEDFNWQKDNRKITEVNNILLLANTDIMIHNGSMNLLQCSSATFSVKINTAIVSCPHDVRSAQGWVRSQ